MTRLMTRPCFLGLWLFLTACGMTAAAAHAHDVPRSHIEVRYSAKGADVILVASAIGFAHEVPALLQNGAEGQKAIVSNRAAMARVIAARFAFSADGQPLIGTQTGSEALPASKAVRLNLRYAWANLPKALTVRGDSLFPIDPNHQVFVTIYNGATLEREVILSKAAPVLTSETGTRQSVLLVISQFVREGIRHIFIGPDHILFIVGLLLLGGGIKSLLKVVTTFTVAHSLTLALATLNLLNPSPQFIEPMIALSIVFVGIHSLTAGKAPGSAREESGTRLDLRLVFAFCFGLIHGFGFANVLRELELPREALVWSLFSFNVGVEIGQIGIVLIVTTLLSLLRRRSEPIYTHTITVASWGVLLAGAFWFGQRLAP